MLWLMMYLLWLVIGSRCILQIASIAHSEEGETVGIRFTEHMRCSCHGVRDKSSA